MRKRARTLSEYSIFFIRCNSGGTPLSYSNLLLSIAVSQWEKLDARKEVHGLVDEMNNVRPGLLFNADFVLKAGLMLTDLASVGFRVENFTRENMAILEKNWSDIRQALLETVELVDSFGFDSRTIQATNSLLPIAYYLYKKGAPHDFETSDRFLADRKTIRGWLTRSILKETGIWGSGLDTLLTALRDVIRNSSGSDFPAGELRRVMSRRGKELDFESEEIEDLADMRLGDRRIFPLLTMLFSYLESRDGADIDHVFPKSRFTPNRLKAAGIADEQVDAFRERYDRLANLQLLDRSVNNEKRATLPADWLDIHCPDSLSRQTYCDRHLLGRGSVRDQGLHRILRLSPGKAPGAHCGPRECCLTVCYIEAMGRKSPIVSHAAWPPLESRAESRQLDQSRRRGDGYRTRAAVLRR